MIGWLPARCRCVVGDGMALCVVAVAVLLISLCALLLSVERAVPGCVGDDCMVYVEVPAVG